MPEASERDGDTNATRARPWSRLRRWLLRDNPDAWWLAALFGAIALITVALVLAYELDPGRAWFLSTSLTKRWSRTTTDTVMFAGACVGFAGLLGYGLARRLALASRLRRRRHLVIASKLLVALLVLVMGLNYFYVRRATQHHWVHLHDTYHYTLGPKYYAEYDYFWHYKCTAEATSPKLVADNAKSRNLWTYQKVKVRALRRTRECEAKFTPERWQEYKRDLATYGEHRLSGSLKDYGYNGTPLHAFVVGRLANSFELTYTFLTTAALLDVVLICVMLFAVARSFGWRLGLLFALMVFTTSVDRFSVIGGSVLRYSWWVTLGLGIAALHDRRWATAAFWLVAAAMLNVFPLLFLFGACVSLLGRCVRARALVPAARRFLIAATVSTLALGALSVSHARGLGNYRDFFADMRVHKDGPPVPGTHGKEKFEKHPGFGVGLKFPFMYRGRHSDKSEDFPRTRLSREFKEIKPIVTGIGAGLTALAVLVALRLCPFEGAILVGFTAFFCLLGTVNYYFTCASTLVLLWHRRVSSPGGLLLLALFFGCNVLSHWYLHAVGASMVFNNTVTSSLWCVYLVAMLVYLSRETGLNQRLGRLLAAPRAGSVADDGRAELARARAEPPDPDARRSPPPQP